jgi:hypothetical protein
LLVTNGQGVDIPAMDEQDEDEGPAAQAAEPPKPSTTPPSDDALGGIV